MAVLGLLLHHTITTSYGIHSKSFCSCADEGFFCNFRSKMDTHNPQNPLAVLSVARSQPPITQSSYTFFV